MHRTATWHPEATLYDTRAAPHVYEPHFHYCIPHFFILSFVVREIEPWWRAVAVGARETTHVMNLSVYDGIAGFSSLIRSLRFGLHVCSVQSWCAAGTAHSLKQLESSNACLSSRPFLTMFFYSSSAWGSTYHASCDMCCFHDSHNVRHTLGAICIPDTLQCLA